MPDLGPLCREKIEERRAYQFNSNRNAVLISHDLPFPLSSTSPTGVLRLRNRRPRLQEYTSTITHSLVPYGYRNLLLLVLLFALEELRGDLERIVDLRLRDSVIRDVEKP